MVPHGVGCSKPAANPLAASLSPVPILQPKSPMEEGSGQWPAPLPGFVEIALSLWGDNLPEEVAIIPLEPAGEQGPIWIAESTMFSAQFCQDSLSGATYIDMMTCSMSPVGLGVTPLAGDCPMPTLLGEEDMDSN